MEMAKLYEAKVSEVPVIPRQEWYERYQHHRPPILVANADEAIPHECVETVRLPIERFHINGRKILVAFGRELKDLMLCSDEETKARLAMIPRLQDDLCEWQTRSRHLESELSKYGTFWRRLLSLFRAPDFPA